MVTLSGSSIGTMKIKDGPGTEDEPDSPPYSHRRVEVVETNVRGFPLVIVKELSHFY